LAVWGCWGSRLFPFLTDQTDYTKNQQKRLLGPGLKKNSLPVSVTVFNMSTDEVPAVEVPPPVEEVGPAEGGEPAVVSSAPDEPAPLVGPVRCVFCR
jgi:hypothetical protein